MMRYLLGFALLLPLTPSGVRAADYVVSLECLVFDRNTTEEENEHLRESVQDLPRGEKGRVLTEEKIQFLTDNANVLHSVKLTRILGRHDIASQKMKTSDFKMETQVRMIDADKEICRMDIQWGVAIGLPESGGAIQVLTQEHAIRLNTRQFLSSSGSHDSHCIFFLVHAREATDADRDPKKLTRNWGKEFFRKHLQRQRTAKEQ